MAAPSWLLLIWSGVAATCAAALAGALIGGSAPATWSLLPRHRSTGGAVLGTMLAGIILYPVVYGLIFETVGRADARLGVIMGGAHALVAALASLPTRSAHIAIRLAVMHFIYAVALAFLYVTP